MSISPRIVAVFGATGTQGMLMSFMLKFLADQNHQDYLSYKPY
jgi:hypothetical protein